MEASFLIVLSIFGSRSLEFALGCITIGSGLGGFALAGSSFIYLSILPTL